MDKTVYLARMEKVKANMGKMGIDVFFVSPSSNLFYLTGYAVKGDERLLLLVLPADGKPFILANLLYKEQVKFLPVEEFVYWKDGDDPFAVLKIEIAKREFGMGRAAVEPRLPAFFSLPLAEIFPSTVFSLGSSLTDKLRQYKEDAELDLIRKACREADRALAALIERGSYWIGKTEAEFGEALSTELRKGNVVSFGAGIASGPNAAVPHHGMENALIEKGKCFLVDFWGRLEGYYTDCTRTFFFGKPDREFEKIYNIVLEAHLAAEAKARPPYTLGDVDMAARTVIEGYGYGEYFTHRTGHGLGIDVHEGTSADRGVNVPIEPGMVFSIEPGIYFPGRFGVRIENLVAAREKEAEVLHAFPRELTIIESTTRL